MRTTYMVGLGAMLAVLIHTGPVQAQSTIRYVSATGNDSNLCTFAAPCRLFQRAVDLVPAGGVVQALNSAGFGGVTINKSVTISGGGGIVALGTRITINKADALVVLRGLVMDGRRSGATGILINAAAAVHIENCEIERYTGRGIEVDSASEVFVADTVSRDNGIDGLGIFAAGSVAIDNSRFENNKNSGVYSAAPSTITRSIASGNDTGYFAGGAGQMTLETSSALGNGNIGLYVESGAVGRISNSLFTKNVTGIKSDGTLLTRQNNTVSGNDNQTTGALTPLPGT